MTRKPATTALLLVAAGALCAVFLGLGVWQIDRLAWKRALIARVAARLHATPVAAPDPPHWAAISDVADMYRRVAAQGRYRDDLATYVQAVTERGPGFWLMTPLATDRGFTVFINRGFVARRGDGAPGGVAKVTGLLRLTEQGGAFLRRNDPAADRWYSRDVGAIAAARRIDRVAPYFIDADATATATAPTIAARDQPVGGLTTVRFSNNHLIYAVTWFALAAMAAASGGVLLREGRRA